MNGKIDMTSMKLAFPKQPKRKKGQKAKSALQKKKDNSGSKYWKNKAMKQWGAVMHHRFRYCLVNNEDCSGNLEAHHLISRAKVMTRNNIDNGVMLCSNHHKWSPLLSPHMAPVQFTEFLRENYPHKIEWVMKHRNDTGKPNYETDYEYLCELIELDKYE